MSDVTLELNSNPVAINLGNYDTVSGATTLTTANRLVKVSGTGGITMATIAESGITGVMTLTKSGSTARTVTFPDAAIEVQAVDEEKSADFTARLHATYLVTGTCTVTDPTPAQGHEYIVFVRNGTCTIGGVGYIAGQNIKRSYHSGAWSSVVQAALNTAQTWGAAQTFNTGTTTIATADINGGTIDGAVIGGSSAAAATVTNLTATGVINAAVGTSALPSYTFTGDADTGMYRAATNTVGLAGGGIKLFQITTNGAANTYAYGTTGAITINYANGTEAAPTQTLLGDVIGSFRFSSYYSGGNTYDVDAATIQATARENHTNSGGGTGTSLEFRTTAIGATSGGIRWRIDSGGPLVSADLAALATFDAGGTAVTPKLQMLGTASDSIMGLTRYAASGSVAANLIFAKSAGGISTYSATQINDRLGDIYWNGVDTDATTFRTAAAIRGHQDTAAASGYVSGRLSFLTAPASAGTAIEALRINSAQQVQHLATTASTSTTTGCSTFAGGVGVAKEIVLTASATGAVYWGPTGSDGSTRCYGNGSGAIIFEKRTGGNWVETGRFG